MKTTNHHGWFSRPGAIDVGLVAKAIRPVGYRAQQSQLDAATIEVAEGPCQIRWQIRKQKVQPAAATNRYGRRVSLGARTFASAAEHRAFWVDLLTKNQPPKK
jgi:hypothetical protein